MIKIDVKSDMEGLKKVLSHIPGAAQRAAARALTRAMKAARTAAGRSISEEYAVKGAEVKRYMRIVHGRTQKGKDTFSAKLLASSEPWELSKFPHKPKKAGSGGPGRPPLRVEVKRGQWKAVPGAFVAPLGGVPKIVSRASRQSLPMRKLPAVNPAIMLRNERVREHVYGRSLEVFRVRLAHEMQRALEKGAKK